MDLRVTDFLPQGELLSQLAEEASELAHAALKLRRVMDGRNPTPVSYMLAVKNLNEEVADVLLCAEQITFLDESQIAAFKKGKLTRLLDRLKDWRKKEDARKKSWAAECGE